MINQLSISSKHNQLCTCQRIACCFTSRDGEKAVSLLRFCRGPIFSHVDFLKDIYPWLNILRSYCRLEKSLSLGARCLFQRSVGSTLTHDSIFGQGAITHSEVTLVGSQVFQRCVGLYLPMTPYSDKELLHTVKSPWSGARCFSVYTYPWLRILTGSCYTLWSRPDREPGVSVFILTHDSVLWQGTVTHCEVALIGSQVFQCLYLPMTPYSDKELLHTVKSPWSGARCFSVYTYPWLRTLTGSCYTLWSRPDREPGVSVVCRFSLPLDDASQHVGG